MLTKTAPHTILRLPIAERKQIAKDTYEVRLRFQRNELPYRPGQYIHVTIPHLENDPRGNGRDFSVTSAPGSPYLSIAFRNSGSPFKRALLSMQRSHVEVTGPFGIFTLPCDVNRPLVFIAGGIGVNPFMSMLRHVRARNMRCNVRMIYTYKDPEHAAYLEELQGLTQTIPDFTLVTRAGRCTKEFLVQHAGDLLRCQYLVAGPPLMVREVRHALTSLGIPEERILIEEFVGYSALGEASGVEGVTDYPFAGIAPEKKFGDGIEGELAERSLSDLEALLQALNDTAIVSETNTEGTITFVNDKFVEISKYSQEELIGQNHRILKSDHHTRVFYENLWSTITRGRLWRGRIKNKAKDGSYYWVDTSIAPILNADGVPRKYISVRFPITERQQAEEALEARARQQAVLTDLSQKALTSNRFADFLDTTVRLLSQTLHAPYALVFRLQPQQQQFIVEAAAGLQAPSHAKLVVNAEPTTSMAGFTIAAQGPILLQDLASESRFAGSALLHDNLVVSGVSVLIQGQDVPFGVLQVLCKDKRSFSQEDINFVQAVANLLANTAQNQLDKRKDEFLGIASHELKTPLTSIKTYTQLLIEHEQKQKTSHSLHMLMQIDTQVNKLTELTHDLLDISRINGGKLEYKDERIHLNALVREVLKEQTLVLKKHKLKAKYTAESIVYGDRFRISQVLMNYIANAEKFSPKSNRIVVRTTSENGLAIVSVEDFGVGVPRKDQPFIFERFYQGSGGKDGPFPGGLGLGLYISAEIIKRHHGEVWHENKVDGGSIFYFSLPVHS